jgi:hypothetical protein
MRIASTSPDPRVDTERDVLVGPQELHAGAFAVLQQVGAIPGDLHHHKTSGSSVFALVESPFAFHGKREET